MIYICLTASSSSVVLASLRDCVSCECYALNFKTTNNKTQIRTK